MIKNETSLQNKPIRVLVLELVEEGITSTKNIILNVQSLRKDVFSHSIRARLSEAVLKKELVRLEEGVYDIYRESEINSVLDYPNRGPWGESSYRGNFSGFLVRDLFYQLRPGSILDVFEGSGTTRDFFQGLEKEKGITIEYTGLDLKNGFDVTSDLIQGKYDLIIAHFPYWSIIKYSSDSKDLSNCPNYLDFIRKVWQAMKNMHSALTDDGTIAVVVGDVRRNGEYFPIFSDIINMKIGTLRSVIIKKQNNCRSTGIAYRKNKYFVPIAHEYVLLFSKD